MDEKLKEQFEQFVEECGENYNNVDKVKKPCIALTFLTFWKLSLRHCPHAVKREKKEEKSRQINLCVLFTVAFTSTQYSTVYLNMIPLSKDAWMFFLQENLPVLQTLSGNKFNCPVFVCWHLPFQQNKAHLAPPPIPQTCNIATEMSTEIINS